MDDEKECAWTNSKPICDEYERLHLPDYESIEKCIYAFPLLNESADMELTDALPYYEAFGYDWIFAFQDQDGSQTLQSITFEIIEAWDISLQKLMRATKKNIANRLSDVAYMLLFGKIDSNIYMPFLKVYFKGESENDSPPFGASLILSDAVMRRLEDLIGNFSVFLYDINTVYALPTEALKKNSIHPVKAFKSIIQGSSPEGEPVFFQAGLLFPEKAVSDDSEARAP